MSDELGFVNPKLINVNSGNVFDELQKKIHNYSETQNQIPPNFIEEIDSKMDKVEKITENLKGKGFYLVDTKLTQDGKESFLIKKPVIRNKRRELENFTIKNSFKVRPKDFFKLSKSQKTRHNTMERIHFLEQRNTILHKRFKIENSIEALGQNSHIFDSKQSIIEPNNSSKHVIEKSINHKGENSDLFLITNFDQMKRDSDVENQNSKIINLENHPSRNRLSLINKAITNPNEKTEIPRRANSMISESLFSETNKIKLIENNETSDLKNLNSVALMKQNNPIVYKALYDMELEEYNRRKELSLVNQEDIDTFVKAIREKTKNKMNNRYSLIPKPKISSIIKDGNPLNKIYNKCIKEEKVSEQIDKILVREKYKVITNSNKEHERHIRKLQMEQDCFVLDGDESEDKLLNPTKKGEKVFIYNSNGEGKYVSKSIKDINQSELATKISDNLAYINRHFLMNDFEDNSIVPNFFFLEELKKYQKEKLLEKTLMEKQYKIEKDKHGIVENYLDNTKKQKELLMSKVSSDLLKVNKSRQGNYDFDEKYLIDYFKTKENSNIHNNNIINQVSSNLNKLNANINSKNLFKNKSHGNINSILPQIKSRKSKLEN